LGQYQLRTPFYGITLYRKNRVEFCMTEEKMNAETEKLLARGEELIWTVLKKLNKISVYEEEIRTPEEWRRESDMNEMLICLALFEQYLYSRGILWKDWEKK